MENKTTKINKKERKHFSLALLLANISKHFKSWKIVSFRYKGLSSTSELRRVFRCENFAGDSAGSVVLLGNETMNVGRSKDKEVVYVEFMMKAPKEESTSTEVFRRYYMVFVNNKRGGYNPAYCCKAPISDTISQSPISHIDITDDILAVNRLLEKSLEISDSQDYKSRLIM